LNKRFRRGAGWAITVAIACSAPLLSHDPITTKLTWTREISRIVYKRCGGCHHAGGAAMDLTHYDAARPWAKAIRDEVLTRRMPPWGAVKGIGGFADDPSLSQPEIDMFVAWVEGGAPEGDPADLSVHPPTFQLQSPALPRYTRTLTVSKDVTLSRATSVLAIRPKYLPDQGSLEAWAMEPDGKVDRLIWLNGSRNLPTRNYVLLNPIALPAGTKLRVAGETGSLIFYCR
jgi:hypothetical protein